MLTLRAKASTLCWYLMTTRKNTFLGYIKTHKLNVTSYVFVALLAIMSAAILFVLQHTTDTSAVSFNKAMTQDGYTLIAPTKSKTIYLVNNKGKTVHSWQTSHYPGLQTELLPNGQLLRTYDNGNEEAFDMGGRGGGLQLINWDGSVAWDYTYDDDTHVLHHDAEMMPNGHILTTAWVKIPADEALAAGVSPDTIDEKSNTVWDGTVLEIDPATNEIVWQWDAFDHLVQNYDAAKPNYGEPADYPRRIDANYYPYATKPDWLHINAVDYNAETDQVMISAREFNELWIVDHSTTTAQAASSVGGTYGHGGDLLYRYGSPESYGAGDDNNRVFYLQHDTQWIQDKALPGYGNVLLFSNGDKNKGHAFSEVFELKLPQNDDCNYQMTDRGAFAPAKIVWRYAPGGTNKFYSQFMGSAQRLPNGNTLVADAMAGRAIEVNKEGDIVWSFTNHFTDEEASDNQLFRAYKYSPSYSGLTEL